MKLYIKSREPRLVVKPITSTTENLQKSEASAWLDSLLRRASLVVHK